MIAKFIYSFSIILIGMSLGYAIQILTDRGLIRLPVSLERLRKLLQHIAFLFFNPVAVAGAIWVVDMGSIRLAVLPLIGLFALLAGGFLAIGAARILRLEDRQTGAMFCCGSFTNIGSIGALICFVFLGEGGFALVPIYKLFEELCYYAIGFPVARYYSGSQRKEPMGHRIWNLARDPFILVALSSMACGGILNVAGVPRPEFFQTVVSLFVPLAIVCLLASIGMAMRFRRVRGYLRECLAVSLIKFLAVPILVSGFGVLAGFGAIEDGLPLKVVVILSAMPVAFTALVPPSIYDLDLDLANSCWFFTTALLALVLPALLIVLKTI